MRFFRLFVPTFLFLVFLLMPSSAFAQGAGSMFDPIIPEACKCLSVPIEGGTATSTSVSAPAWGCVLVVIQNVINTAVGVAVIVIILAIVYAGFMFMTSGGSPERRTQGRNVLGNSIIGLLILLGAWLGVDFVMKIVYNPNAVFSGSTQLGPWNAIWSSSGDDRCLVVRQPTPITSGSLSILFGSPGSYSGGGGSCTAPTSGSCTAAALQEAFGSAAAQAAQVCRYESGGNPQNLSRTDRTADGNSYSVGLFQINLTNSFNRRVNGKSCSAAFSGPCQGRAVVQRGSQVGRCSARVTDKPLYDACVAAAQNPSTNIAAARALYDGDWGRWSNTAQKCNLPR